MGFCAHYDPAVNRCNLVKNTCFNHNLQHDCHHFIEKNDKIAADDRLSDLERRVKKLESDAGGVKLKYYLV